MSLWHLRALAHAGMLCNWLAPFVMLDGHLLVGFGMVGVGSLLVGFAVEARRL